MDQTFSNRSCSNCGVVSVECQKLRKIFGFEHEFWQGMILTCCLNLEIGSDELKNRWWNMSLNKMCAYYIAYYLCTLVSNGLWRFYLQHSKLVRLLEKQRAWTKTSQINFWWYTLYTLVQNWFQHIFYLWLITNPKAQ